MAKAVGSSDKRKPQPEQTSSHSEADELSPAGVKIAAAFQEAIEAMRSEERRSDRARFEAVLAKVPDTPPEEQDALD